MTEEELAKSTQEVWPLTPEEIKEEEIKRDHPIKELIRFAILALIIVIPIRAFIAQPFLVSGSSMEPTFHNGDYLIVDEISYKLASPKRGDVIVFRFPEDKSKFYIKRIIGLPGETVVLKDGKVIIKNSENLNGFALSEEYIKKTTIDSMTVSLKEGNYFVMGDNRPASSDSRAWGTLERKYFVGRALVRMYPVNGIALFPGQ